MSSDNANNTLVAGPAPEQGPVSAAPIPALTPAPEQGAASAVTTPSTKIRTMTAIQLRERICDLQVELLRIYGFQQGFLRIPSLEQELSEIEAERQRRIDELNG